ncbi:MAG TPA: PEP-CTERM sorting domain-containing protein [bacterium]|nr:PEP-CTERM sorting domain-containing protein [bacterium]
MRRISVLTTLLVIGVAVLGMAAAASANSIVTSVPTITPLGGGLFKWSYTLSIDSNQLIPVNSGTQPCTTTGSLGSATQCSFFTLFDIKGLTGTPTFASSIAGFTGTVTTPFTGPTAFNSSTPDSGAIPNIDVAFINGTGASISGATLGTLTFDSTASGSAFGFFSAQADSTSNGFATGNQGQVQEPRVPEPAALTLLPIGIAAVLLRRKR